MKRDQYMGMDVHEWIGWFNKRRLLEASGYRPGPKGLPAPGGARGDDLVTRTREFSETPAAVRQSRRKKAQ